jgi:hypothetical protein
LSNEFSEFAYSAELKADLIRQVDANSPTNFILHYFDTDLVNKPIIDITSRMCLTNTQPCGAFCCGACDTVCQTCTPVSQCPPSTNCSQALIVQNNCCVPSPAPACQIPVGTCDVGTCNVATGTIQFVFCLWFCSFFLISLFVVIFILFFRFHLVVHSLFSLFAVI